MAELIVHFECSNKQWAVVGYLVEERLTFQLGMLFEND